MVDFDCNRNISPRRRRNRIPNRNRPFRCLDSVNYNSFAAKFELPNIAPGHCFDAASQFHLIMIIEA